MWKLTEKFPDFTYWKSVFLDIFCPVLTLHQDASKNLVWAHGPDPTWSLKIGFGSKGIQNQKFRFYGSLKNSAHLVEAQSLNWCHYSLSLTLTYGMFIVAPTWSTTKITSFSLL